MSEAPTIDERASLLPFLESLKSDKSNESIRPFLRVTPKGLFISEAQVESLLKSYQGWILRESKGVAQKSLEKCHQRLFETVNPERQYLIEGKVVFTGFLIPLPLKIPQQYGLPYYLGSLLSTKSYLHPGDPALAKIKGLQLKHEKTGLEAHVTRGESTLVVSDAVIRSFQGAATHSRYLQRVYPDITQSLSSSLAAVVSIVRRSREVKRELPVPVPMSAKRNQKGRVRLSGKFLLTEERGRITRIIELNGRNLSSYLREELKDTPRELLGSLRLTPRERDIIGFYEQGRQRTAVHARAFAEYCESICRARDPREKFSGWFTAGECFQRFTSSFQLSQPIDKKKIENVLKARGINPYSCKMNGGWIFVVGKDGTVLRTVAKHIRLPGHSRRT